MDCTWSDWGNWTNCNLTCGGGQQMRPRFEIGPYHGGQPCNGSDEDWRDCNAHFCPSGYFCEFSFQHLKYSVQCTSYI